MDSIRYQKQMSRFTDCPMNTGGSQAELCALPAIMEQEKAQNQDCRHEGAKICRVLRFHVVLPNHRFDDTETPERAADCRLDDFFMETRAGEDQRKGGQGNRGSKSFDLLT
jgi:hypothetical protein